MQRVKNNGLNLWQFNLFKNVKEVKHFVTDRAASDGRKEFTLSYSSSPDKEELRSNRNLLASAVGVQNDSLYIPSQVHQSLIVQVSNSTSPEELLETDALITNEKGLCIAILVADCVPVLLFD
ncbi:hypothetical protein BH23BAC1_BH23BAC1_43340 [soil metagenome]